MPLGTGYFGARDADGRLFMARPEEQAAGARVLAIEMKLSQGGQARPGRHAPRRQGHRRDRPDPRHPPGPRLREPVGAHRVHGRLLHARRRRGGRGPHRPAGGIKSAVGDLGFWTELADKMAADPGRGVGFVNVDGGEGGTDAAPLVFADHVALPYVGN